MITRRVTLLNPVMLGAYLSVVIQITLEKQTEALLEVFETAMADFPEVMECYLMNRRFRLFAAGRGTRHRCIPAFIVD